MINWLWNRLFGLTHKQIGMLGLDCVGKTMILYKLKLGEVVVTIPTGIGFNLEDIQLMNTTLTIRDFGGQGRYEYAATYFRSFQGLIYVVDSNDRDRIDEARNMLQTLLAEPELAGLPLLVFANKQDLPFAMSISAVIDGLKLHGTSDRKWHVQGCNSISGDGLYEGLEWFTTVLKSTGEK